MFQSTIILAIGVGGAVGAVTRYVVTGLTRQLLGESFPYGTLVVNLLGCLALGCMAELAATWNETHPNRLPPWLHHGLTIHGSGPNTTDDRRIAAVIRYCTPDISQQVSDRDYAMLVRGEDRHGNFTAFPPPEVAFSPESLKQYEEIRAAQAKAMMSGAKKQGSLYA